MIIADVSDYIASMEASIDKISEIGSSLIQEGDVILTICNSDTVVRILKAAKSQGKGFKVFACETRPRYQGHITAKELSAAGLDVTLIVDSAANFTMRQKGVTKVFVGADTVYASGQVINKIGTSQVAQMAHALGLAVYVCTETLKFYPYSVHGATVEIEERDTKEVADIKGVNVFNPAFDITDPHSITGIITEDGVIEPAMVDGIIREKYAWAIG
jgi:ribose 1,5-bisphosphate isomerase